MIHSKRLFSGILVCAAVVLGVRGWVPIARAEHTSSHTSAEILPLPVDDGAVLPASDFVTSSSKKVSIDTSSAQGGVSSATPKKVPEPATIVSLAGLAAIAGISLLLRVRWFRGV